jgi:2'-5' RNA ligase
MIDLTAHYNQLYHDSLRKIKADDYQPDTLIDPPTDQRLGVTLVCRPNAQTNDQIQSFIEKLKRVEPHQYFYPASDIHITVMSIISCYQGFQLSSISVDDYRKVIQKSLEGCHRFEIEFRGLTASPSCLMIQGFPYDETLNLIRNNLRNNFHHTTLEQSIDKRYAIQTAHATICRLKQPLTNKDAYLKLIEAYRDYNFGTFTVNTLEFVLNDWYQRKEKVKILYQFELC